MRPLHWIFPVQIPSLTSADLLAHLDPHKSTRSLDHCAATPKGRHESAQGNALGKGPVSSPSPEGAQYHDEC